VILFRVMPFTIEQFLEVFRAYNEAVYPAQWALFGIAVAAVVMSLPPAVDNGRRISAILAVLWAWTGIAYHIAFFTGINPLAYVFGAMCIVQALLFVYHGVLRGRMRFDVWADAAGITGAVLILFALVAYPILGYLLGRVYPYSPTFGAPCPTTIFTFGILLWNRDRTPVHLIAIPFLWSLIGFSAAVSLSIREDMGLFLAGLVTAVFVVRNAR